MGGGVFENGGEEREREILGLNVGPGICGSEIFLRGGILHISRDCPVPNAKWAPFSDLEDDKD